MRVLELLALLQDLPTRNVWQGRPLVHAVHAWLWARQAETGMRKMSSWRIRESRLESFRACVTGLPMSAESKRGAVICAVELW